MTVDERLMNIEIKIARQEDVVDDLNKLVYQQQKKIDALELLCAALARHIQDVRDAATDRSAGNEKPPHY